MELSIEDMSMVIEALGTLDAEYGSPRVVALAERVRVAREARLADAERAR